MFDGLDSEIWSSEAGGGEIAAMVLGAVAVLLVLGGATGALLVATGKIKASSGLASKGTSTLLAFFGGSVLIGSLTGAVAWSSTAGGEQGGIYGLMPEDARPGAVEVEVESTLVSCEEPVVWESDAAGPKVSEYEAGHEKGLEVVKALGVGDQFENDSDRPRVSDYIVEVSWLPAEGDCTPDNQSAAGGTTVSVKTVTGVGPMGASEDHETYEYEAPESSDG